MNSISSATFSAASPSFDAAQLDDSRIHLRALDGEFAGPDAVDGFDPPRNRNNRSIFESSGESLELTKPEAQAFDPDQPQKFAIVPILVAAGEAVVTLAGAVVVSLIANEITRRVHQTNQTKPQPMPPQPPPTGPANPQAGIVITPLPPPT